jgi:tetratricopeptide (TPR) repeat protein
MSLVNDVLRDLNGRRELPEHGLSFPGLINNKETEVKRPYQGLLLIVSFTLVVVLSIQLIYKKPISQILSPDNASDSRNDFVTISTDNITPDAAQVNTGVLKTNAIASINAVESIDAVKPADVVEVQPLSMVNRNDLDYEIDLIKDNMQKAVVQEAVLNREVVQKEISIAIMEDDKNSIIKKQAAIKHVVEITKVSIAGDFNYQRAIKEYKQQRFSAALASINSAIKESQDEKIKVFKARILLKQKDAVGFLNFIQQQSKNSSLNWFQLVAPGLQLLSYYELSNQYYSQLIKKQPENIKWPLAMALNYSKLNQQDKTQGIYQSLLKSSLLSMKQKKWILSQVQNMNKSLGNKEGHRYGS